MEVEMRTVSRTLLPGMFDCHVHLVLRGEDLDELRVMHEPFSYRFFRVAENLRTTLAIGITTVRDTAGADLGLKRAVEDGVLVGRQGRPHPARLTRFGRTLPSPAPPMFEGDPWH